MKKRDIKNSIKVKNNIGVNVYNELTANCLELNNSEVSNSTVNTSG